MKKKLSQPLSLRRQFARLPTDKKRRLIIKSTVTMGIFGVAAGALSHYDQQSKELHDLSIIGQGRPVVVQIHDTSCSICRKLKSRTTHVLDELDTIEYRIADIRSRKGREFQQQYRAEKTTLLLFDGEGQYLSTIAGLQTLDQLKQQFIRAFPSPA